MPLDLRSSAEIHTVPDEHLLVGLDETGHELLSDPAYPVFGLGGCAVPAGMYGDLIARPWREMKGKHFGSPDAPLHAADLRAPSHAQLGALAEFFAKYQFARYAVVLTDKTVLSPEVVPYQLVAGGVVHRIAKLLNEFQCTGVALIAESSQRGDRLTAGHFDGYSFTLTGPSGTSIVPFLKGRMDKARSEPIVEVADFIIQAAGGQVRAHLRGAQFGSRKDFQAVFRSVAETRALFIQVDRVEVKTTG